MNLLSFLSYQELRPTLEQIESTKTTSEKQRLRVDQAKSELSSTEQEIAEASKRERELQDQLKAKRETGAAIQTKLDRGDRIVGQLSADFREVRHRLARVERRLARLHRDALAMAFRLTILSCFSPKQR